jgi:pimeloyl-ACP methyl ester carboxylesterase
MPGLRVDNVELYYELHGPQGADVLVLSNGILMSTVSWAFQMRDLSARYRLLLYDCRGQWQSDHPPGPYTMEQHADDLASLLGGLGIERAHIGGISYGGEVSLMFALRYPECTRSLIVADAVSHVDPPLRIVAKSWIETARTGEAQAFFDATVPWNFSPGFIRAHPGLLTEALSRYELLDYPAVIRLCECFLAFDVTQRLGEIGAPTCIIVGEDDILKGREYAEIMAGHIAGAELHVILRAGHATCWEQPQVFNSIVLGFLAKQG